MVRAKVASSSDAGFCHLASAARPRSAPATMGSHRRLLALDGAGARGIDAIGERMDIVGIDLQQLAGDEVGLGRLLGRLQAAIACS